MVVIKKKHVESEEEKAAKKQKEQELAMGLQDEYQAKGFELVTWVQDHKVLVSCMIAFLLLAGAGFSVFKYYQDRKAEFASSDYIKALSTLQEESSGEKLGTDERLKIQKSLLEIAEKYSQSGVAKLAQISAGRLALESQQDPKQTIEIFSKAKNAIRATEELYPIVLLNLGYAYEKNKELDKALSVLDEIINGKVDIGKEEALWQSARIAKELKKTPKEKEVLGKLVEEYPSSIFGEKARMRLSTLNQD